MNYVFMREGCASASISQTTPHIWSGKKRKYIHVKMDIVSVSRHRSKYVVHPRTIRCTPVQ